MKFNYYGFKAIYLHEMDRLWRTLFQSILSPVVSTSLYFIVFGSVIGGMVIQFDDKLLDLSIAKELKEIRKQLIYN